MSTTKLTKLDVNNPLFKELKNNPPNWWKLLKEDKDIYIDIRKDSTIDVYYHGGALLGDVKFEKNEFSWKTHFKYLIPSLDSKLDYIPNSATATSLPIDNSIASFDSNKIKKMKCNINLYYSKDSEKGIQGNFITQQESCFIDSEFAFNESDKSRVDMVWIDTTNKKIIFVELKKPDNKELTNGSIVKQLTKYIKLISKNKSTIENYFKSLFLVKKNLKILPKNLQSLPNIDNFTLNDTPLLLVSKCTADWIKNNSTKIDSDIKGKTFGVYYFGDPNICNIIAKTNRNRHIL